MTEDLLVATLPLGALVAFGLFGWDVVRRPLAVWPWFVGWIVVTLPSFGFLVYLYGWVPPYEPFHVLLLELTPVVMASWLATLFAMALVAARVLRAEGGHQRRLYGPGIAGGIAISLFALGWLSPRDANLAWLALGITWCSVLAGGTGNRRFLQGRAGAAGLLLAAMVLALVVWLLITQRRFLVWEQHDPASTFRWEPLGLAAGALVVVGWARRPSLVPVLAAASTALLLGAQRYDRLRLHRVAEEVGAPFVDGTSEASLNHNPTCAHTGFGRDEREVGRCVSAQNWVQVLPANTPLDRVPIDRSILLRPAYLALRQAQSPVDHEVIFAGDRWALDGQGPLEQEALWMALRALPDGEAFAVHPTPELDLQAFVDLCTHAGNHPCKIYDPYQDGGER